MIKYFDCASGRRRSVPNHGRLEAPRVGSTTPITETRGPCLRPDITQDTHFAFALGIRISGNAAPRVPGSPPCSSLTE